MKVLLADGDYRLQLGLYETCILTAGTTLAGFRIDTGNPPVVYTIPGELGLTDTTIEYNLGSEIFCRFSTIRSHYPLASGYVSAYRRRHGVTMPLDMEHEPVRQGLMALALVRRLAEA